MSMRGFLPAAALLLMPLLFLTGCGDEGAATDPEPETTSTAQAEAAELSFDHAAATSDPFDDPSGPYFHQVMKASSPDGLSFVKISGVVLDKASVPDIIRMPDGRLIIYAVDGGGRSDSGLMVAVSDDDGQTWQQGSLPVEYQGNHRQGVDPDAVVLDDGSVRLYYIVFPDRQPPLDAQGNPIPGSGEPIRVMSATSTDGIHFVEEEGVRLQAADTEFVTDPDVVKIGDTWFMYLSEGQTDIAYVSDDGMSFTRSGPVRDDGAVSNTVPIGGGRYRQYFCRRGISSAVTSDGLNFQDDPGVRLEADPGKIACDPAPVEVDGLWLMFYKTEDSPQPGQQGVGPAGGPPGQQGAGGPPAGTPGQGPPPGAGPPAASVFRLLTLTLTRP